MIDFTIRRDNGGRIIWSEDQISYIINEYKNNSETGILAEQFKVTKQAIRSLLKRNKVHVLSAYEYGVKDYPRDINAFKVKDFKMAYWLGFLYADGCIQNNEITINLQESDLSQLYNFKNYLKAYNNEISLVSKKTYNKIYTGYHFSIKDKYIANTLRSLGMISKKSLILEPPTLEQIPLELQWDFIRGYFDGDGWFNLDARSNNYRIGFIGTKNMMNFIQSKINTSVKLEQISENNTYKFMISGNKNIKSVLYYLYLNSTEDTRLKRKYTIYLEYLNYSA